MTKRNESAIWIGVLASTLIACTDPASDMPVGIVTNTVDEPAGNHCVSGGIAVQAGVDDDGDGILEQWEIDKVDYVCGANGPATLTRENAIAAGDVCPRGGTAVQTGRDLDRDGVLDDAEVEQTVNVCDRLEIWNGSIKTSEWTTSEKLDLLAHIRVVNGSVDIDTSAVMPGLEIVTGDVSTSGEVVELPALRTIAGRLTQAGWWTKQLALPHLQRVGADVVVRSTAPNAVISAPALTTVADAVLLSTTDSDTIDLSSLTSVGGDLYLSSNGSTAALQTLATIGGSLQIELSETNAQFPALHAISGDVRVTSPAADAVGGENDASLSCPALTTIGGSVTVSSKTLHTLDFASLTDVGNDMRISETQLTSLELPHLRHIGGVVTSPSSGPGGPSLLVLRNKLLATINVPALETVVGSILIDESDALTALDVPALTMTGELELDSCPALAEVRAAHLSTVGRLALSKLPALTSAAFPELTTAFAVLDVNATALTTLSGFSSLRYAEYVFIERNHQLVDMRGLEQLTRVDGLDIMSNAGLTSLRGLDKLAHADGTVEIQWNTKLVDVSALASLRYVGTDLRIGHNQSLASLAGLEQLATIHGGLFIDHNAALASLAGLAGLTTLGGDLKVTFNAALPPGDIDALRMRLGR